MALIDVQHSFFVPMWRRVATVVFCVGWTIVEIAGGSIFWIILFGSLAAYCSYEFFFAFDPDGKLRREAEGNDE